MVGSLAGYPEGYVEEALEGEHLSLWELCEGNLDGGLPCWVP